MTTPIPYDPLMAVDTERAYLIAALSKLFPASLEADPEAGEWLVCMIDLPTGQVSWHIARHDLHLFRHLPEHQGRHWDGHTTYEKYHRLDALTGYWAWPNPTLSPAERFRRESQNDPRPDWAHNALSPEQIKQARWAHAVLNGFPQPGQQDEC